MTTAVTPDAKTHAALAPLSRLGSAVLPLS
jgi:hypothetical protein